MSKLKLWSDYSADALSYMNTITLEIRGHLCQGAFCECEMQSYVANMSDLIIVWRGFQETIKRSHCSSKWKRHQTWERENKDKTYQRRNILIYYCVSMIPISIISIPRIYWLCEVAAPHRWRALPYGLQSASRMTTTFSYIHSKRLYLTPGSISTSSWHSVCGG